MPYLRKCIPRTRRAEELTEKDKGHQQIAKEKIQEMIDRLNNQELTRFWP
jgi:hypothetical protein